MGRGQTRVACQGGGGRQACKVNARKGWAAGAPVGAAGTAGSRGPGSRVPAADRAAQVPHLGAQPDGDLEGPYVRDHTSL